jgi:hypothetical protein
MGELEAAYLDTSHINDVLNQTVWLVPYLLTAIFFTLVGMWWRKSDCKWEHGRMRNKARRTWVNYWFSDAVVNTVENAICEGVITSAEAQALYIRLATVCHFSDLKPRAILDPKTRILTRLASDAYDKPAPLPDLKKERLTLAQMLQATKII